MLTESVLLGALGGSAGLAIAACALYAVRKMHPGNIPRLDEIGIDPWVMAFTLAISLFTGLLFGLAPALRALSVDLISTLRAGGGSPRGGGLSVRRDKLRGALVVAELAVSLTLLVGAGLLVRSFIQILKVPPGFDPTGVISMRVSTNGVQYREAARRIQFYRNIAEKVRSLPGIPAKE
jgi:putative ABC transport system permease protein